MALPQLQRTWDHLLHLGALAEQLRRVVENRNAQVVGRLEFVDDRERVAQLGHDVVVPIDLGALAGLRPPGA